MNTKFCKKCQQGFIVREEDRVFYERIKVPAPTLCPQCRFQRRETFRNERALYSRTSDKSGKPIISIFAPDSPFKVYAQDEWWADDWEPPKAEFDFSRPFFEQFRELQLKAPRLSLLSKDSDNSDYANHSAKNRNVYMGFSVIESEDIYYGMMINKCRSLTDCTYMYEGSELSYECFFGFQLYQCGWCLECRNTLDCWFCYDCVGSTNCFMSSNLRNKTYVFYNEQLTKEDYEQKMKELFPLRADKVEELRKQWTEMYERNAVHKFANMVNCHDSTGDYMLNCKACYQCLHTKNSENCAYMYHTWDMKDCMDVTNTLGELCYETHGVVGMYEARFVNYSYDNQFVEYCDHTFNSEHCFGCVGIKRGKFRILNTQYSEEEYHALRARIIEHMKKTGEYGEFFPSSVSPFAYNETVANDIFPLTKEEAFSQGFTWRDNVPGTRGKETKKAEEIAQTSSEAGEQICQEVLACMECKKNYKIIKPELDFYVRMKLPIPRRCPDCRYRLRLNAHNPKVMFERQCACIVSVHGNHRAGRCANRFVTKYKAGALPEKVYCEPCYQSEVV